MRIQGQHAFILERTKRHVTNFNWICLDQPLPASNSMVFVRLQTLKLCVTPNLATADGEEVATAEIPPAVCLIMGQSKMWSAEQAKLA